MATKPCWAETRSPGVELAVCELDDAMTARADEVMVVLVAAPAVAELALAVGERVDHAFVRELSVRHTVASPGGRPGRAAARGDPER